jgi:hypothetical protein
VTDGVARPILGKEKAAAATAAEEESQMSRNPASRLHSSRPDRCVYRTARERLGRYKAELRRGDIRRGARRPSPGEAGE